MAQITEEYLEIVQLASENLQNDEISQINQSTSPLDSQSQLYKKSWIDNTYKEPITASKQSHKKQVKPFHKKTKKLILYRCKICKTAGKKSTIKMCTKCKFHFHKECLDPQKLEKQQKAFICEICQKTPQSFPLKKQENDKKTNVKKEESQLQKDKQNNGFINISRLMNVYRANFKKQEWKRKLYQFYKRYPYCFQDNKVIFPLQDHLLHIYQSIFPSYCKTTTVRPKPTYDGESIPQNLYDDLLQIQIFFNNFWEDLKTNNFFTKKDFVQNFTIAKDDFKRKSLYKIFSHEGMTTKFCDIYQILIRVYLNDILDRNRIDNMKYISANAFFGLLSAVSQDNGLSRQFILKLSPQIIKNITKIPSFRRSFSAQLNSKINNQITLAKKWTLQTKIHIILKLIRGLCDTQCFKQLISKKAEQISLLTKEKGEITTDLKTYQAQNISFKQKIKQIEQQIKQLAFSDPKQYAKRYETNTKKLQKQIISRKKNDQKIKQLKSKIKQITKNIPFVNSPVKFLGVDRFKSEYFFYQNENNKIFVKYKESFLSQKYQESFLCYRTKADIQKLKNWLNSKGVNQKSLLFNLNNIEQKQICDFKDTQLEVIDYAQREEQNRIQKLESITRQQNIDNLLFCQNLYKQVLPQKQSLTQRSEQMNEILKKLSDKQKVHSESQLNSNENQSIWKQYFAKYNSKIWSLNQKVKKFWFEFLQIFTSEHHHCLSQPNLMLLIAVFKNLLKLYHNQTLRRKEKHQKRKEKQRIQRIKQADLYQQQFSQSPQQKNNDNEYQKGRRLRKRQNHVNGIQQSQQCNSGDQINHSSKKSSSNQEQSTQNLNKSSKVQKASKKIENPTKKSETNIKKPVLKKKKLQIQSDSEISQPSSVEQQQSQKPQHVNNSNKLNQNKDYHQQDQISPEQQYCEQCFQNVFYQKMNKVKVIRCQQCHKIYHKKCLQEEDGLRFKASPDQWKCWECYSTMTMEKNVVSERQSQRVQKKSKFHAKDKQNDFLRNSQSKFSEGQQISVKKSKNQQKKQKKQRKMNKSLVSNKKQAFQNKLVNVQQRQNKDYYLVNSLENEVQYAENHNEQKRKKGRPRKVKNQQKSLNEQFQYEKPQQLHEEPSKLTKKSSKTTKSNHTQKQSSSTSPVQARPGRAAKTKSKILIQQSTISQSSSQSSQNHQNDDEQYNSESL